MLMCAKPLTGVINGDPMIKFKSKTHNFGILLGICGGVVQFLPTVREFSSPDTYGAVLIAAGAITIILRNVTTVPIDQK